MRTLGSNGGWYVLETNYDNWKEPEKGDNRREAAVRHLNATNSDTFSFEDMWGIMNNKQYYPDQGERPIYT
eukprot:UN23730